ncbi:3-beta hydroxysteroid dehydrogenase/isomerase [Tanacetum coccineum]
MLSTSLQLHCEKWEWWWTLDRSCLCDCLTMMRLVWRWVPFTKEVLIVVVMLNLLLYQLRLEPNLLVDDNNILPGQRPFGLGTIRGSSVGLCVEDDDSCNYDFFSGYTIIVQGVKNIISACRECKVKRLIYNSTADVVLDSSRDIHNGNETLLYATKIVEIGKNQSRKYYVFGKNPSTCCGPDVCDIRTSYVSHQCTSSDGDSAAPCLMRRLAILDWLALAS